MKNAITAPDTAATLAPATASALAIQSSAEWCELESARQAAKADTRFAQLGHRAKGVASACPYTILGKKVLKAFKEAPPQPVPDPDLPSRLRARIVMGRNIALIGFFCPFFWCSLLAGAKTQTVWFNAVHSGIVMLIGLTLMAQAKLALKRTTNWMTCRSSKQTEYRFVAKRPSQAS